MASGARKSTFLSLAFHIPVWGPLLFASPVRTPLESVLAQLVGETGQISLENCMGA
jgi:hypothetical protein